jgi:hypothetical protein
MKKTLIVSLLVLLLAAAAAWYGGFLVLPGASNDTPANAIVMISPYQYSNTWVFDDPKVGLHREPFINGIPEIIDDMVADIPDAASGFRLYFSANPFPGHTHTFAWRRADGSGNWYYCQELDKEGWLCPGLLKYYTEPPKMLYGMAKAKGK